MGAAIGYGTTFGIGAASVYTAVAEVIAVTPPNYARDAVEGTHMGSADKFREYIAGLMDGGEASIEMHFAPSASDVIVAAMIAGVGDFQITFPSGVTWTFDAVVTGYEPGAPLDDRMTATATFKITGKPVLAAAV